MIEQPFRALTAGHFIDLFLLSGLLVELFLPLNFLYSFTITYEQLPSFPIEKN